VRKTAESLALHQQFLRLTDTFSEALMATREVHSKKERDKKPEEITLISLQLLST